MKRLLGSATLAGAAVTAVWMASLSPQAADAQPLFRAWNGGYPSGDGGYSGVGYSPYGYGAYTYNAPVTYFYPPNSSYGFGNSGYGIGSRYNGIIDHSYSGSRFYPQPAYSPYGYGPYGYGRFGRYGY